MFVVATPEQGLTGTDVGECRESLQRKENCSKNLLSTIRAVMLLQKWGMDPALFLNKQAEDRRKSRLPQLPPALLFIS